MDISFAFLGTVFAAFFAMMNPLANTPIFLGLTSDMDARLTRMVALRALGLAVIIVSAFTLSGEFLLNAFGITIAAFKIAGGILVALVGYHLLQGKHSSVHKPTDDHLEASANEEAALGISVSPLAMPLLAGPGTLVTAMNFSVGVSPEKKGAVIAAFFVICIITFFSFIGGKALVRFLGQNVVMVVGRIMGLLLTVVGTQMLIEGTRAAMLATK